MSGEQIHFLKRSMAPVPKDNAVTKTVEELNAYMDQLEYGDHELILDAITNVVLSRAQERGLHYVLESPQHN